MTISNYTSTVLGYPRIGPRRELKRALESYWDGSLDVGQLHATARSLRRQTWTQLRDLGLDLLPSNTFSYYDQVLDTAVLLDLIPDRHRVGDDLASYFAMARGTKEVAPLPMTKWFDTNYHYIVPEIGAATTVKLNAAKVLGELAEARELGLETRPVLVGPVTFLLLSDPSPGSAPGFTPLDRLDDVLAIYAELLALLAAEGVGWVQLDEPSLVTDLSDRELAAVTQAYSFLGGLPTRPQLLVASYFGSLGEALPALASTAIDAVAVDLVRGTTDSLDLLAGKTIVAGVVSGRDVWRTDLARASETLRGLGSDVIVSTSCSLLHVPYDVDAESNLDPALASRLAFARQKVAEVVALARGEVTALRAEDAARAGAAAREGVTREGVASEGVASERVAREGAARERVAAAGEGFAPAGPASEPVREWVPRKAERRSPYTTRAAAQAAHLNLPVLPVTTIGSFPQTGDLRAVRAGAVAGRVNEQQYEAAIEDEIAKVIRLQEELGLDVLVHGEPERNDMVQYFAERLEGFATTQHGWVQSYGSRCTRPPIMHGDVSRPVPMTVRWARYAQSRTSKPVKGMLTGPVTIVAWSFKRADITLAESVWQVAQALRDEVRDLEDAGISIIQVDEPALRELLPLRRSAQAAYLDWAVEAYRHTTSGAADRTQIHTHLCYSDAGTVFAAIDALDADVTTIESARSHGRILGGAAEFERGLGPGVYDIHSPRVPTLDEVTASVAAAAKVIPRERLWVNPDCGLKTRTYPQVEASLKHLVTAARAARDQKDQ
ncbi:5-methyltetrahydropteroyltriglutamate--homocysteine S-methyltransferase [Catelliglobosispora koreensis]|uniref:5-methyltetrahydropteroyltriglutamate-- homocysteine S-methyltransferase n=1 Tax=Catelliglobosispora koreensis TaxID=129052 RepID=UPI0003736D36|nr:5-methyltetrahydropteroyltriglutamate--homocysteine S-methyltransferase [Catelliglobosispora koreensis]